LNPIDVLRYKLAKGNDEHYLFPPFVSGNGTVIDNMRIHESSQVTANTMLVGDFRYGTRYTLGGVTIEMGHINDQFVKNTFTILAEKRVGLLVRNVDADAFLKVTNITDVLNTLIPSV
jgi:HK97 family phage major capsid protein